MKKTFLTSLLALALAACGGGSGTTSVPSGGGNQETYYASFKEYFDNVIKTGADGGIYTNFVGGDESYQIWPALLGKGYKHYEYKEHTYTPENGQIITQHAVDEKELQLANYGIHVTMPNDMYHLPDTIDPYVHNREGVGANLYAPVNGTTFTGETFAYLYGENRNPRVIHGDATYTYNSTYGSELVLDFDDYYTFNVMLGNGNTESVTVSGTNNTGTTGYNVTTGAYVDHGTDTNFAITHLQQGDIQEAVGTYEMQFGDGNIGGNTTNNFTMHGAFGGSHE